MSGTPTLENERRDSVPDEPEVVTDPIARAEAEAANGLRQFDCGKAAAHDALERIASGGGFRLRPSLILALHREALRGISSYAGNWRPGDVKIEKSIHQPPGAHLVPGLVEEMCDYVNDNWDRTPIHLSAYVMWRLNWIHPFADGNGRTSRISSYLVMMVRSGSVLPGSPTIPDQIASDRRGYFAALDAADAAFLRGSIDVSAMEELLGNMLAKQLANFYMSAGGKLPPGVDLNDIIKS